MSGLRVILVDMESARSQMVSDLLRAAGCELAAVLQDTAELPAAMARPGAEVAVVSAPPLDDRLLAGLLSAQSARPMPLVLFTADESADSINRAVQAGVSAYVLDGIEPRRVRPVLLAAMARFRQFNALVGELARTRSQLAERKLIERAKGIVMTQRGLNEEQAYKLMRKTAMDRNKRMADIADSIIAASELLSERQGATQTLTPLGFG